MWKCHKCGKPVYFAERKQSLGYDWHPECLRCEECGKRLNPGQHAEHKGVPYCHVPCYGALFGPQLFGHGTRVESHKSFGQQKMSPKFKGPTIPRTQIETKLKMYNQYYDGKSGEIRCREVNGRLILEGSLRIHWGVQGVIHLKEDDDQRTVVTVRKRNSCRMYSSPDYDSDEFDSSLPRDSSVQSFTADSPSFEKNDMQIESENASKETSPSHDISTKCSTLPPKLDMKSMEWDELDELLQVERKFDDSNKLYQTMPTPLPSQSSVESENSHSESTSTAKEETKPNVDCTDLVSDMQEDENWSGMSNHLNRSMSGPDCLERIRQHNSPEEFCDMTASTTSMDLTTNSDEVVLRRPPKTGSTAIKRRPGKRLSRTKIKRRCSINGHFYNRETSFFTPPHGSQMSVWVTSLVNTQEVINLLLEKYKVESDAQNFALFVVRDNGEQKRLKDEDYPLLVRVLLGPHEDVVNLYLMDSHNTPEVSNEVAQFLNLSLAEMRAIVGQYYSQEEREVVRIQDKFQEMKKRIKQRMDELKVRL